jgi:hypothetical protein
VCVICHMSYRGGGFNAFNGFNGFNGILLVYIMDYIIGYYIHTYILGGAQSALQRPQILQ